MTDKVYGIHLLQFRVYFLEARFGKVKTERFIENIDDSLHGVFKNLRRERRRKSNLLFLSPKSFFFNLRKQLQGLTVADYLLDPGIVKEIRHAVHEQIGKSD